MGLLLIKFDLYKRRFVAKIPKSEGRSAYTNRLMLKIYFYGIFYAYGSIRRPEMECCMETGAN